VVVPEEFASKDGNAFGDFAGVAHAFRQQVVVRAEELTALRGRMLTALWVRRDAALPLPLPGGKAQFVVTLSDRARHPTALVPKFADNRGAQTREVFRGVVEVPTAPAPARGQPAPWAPTSAVELKFTAEFTYRDGPLSIEIEGRPVAGQPPLTWPVDYAEWASDAASTFVGRSCDVRLQAMALWRDLIPGGSIVMGTAGPTQAAAVCLVGWIRRTPIELGAQGAVKCSIHVDPVDARPFVLPRVKLEPITRVEQNLPLPPMACVLGVHFAVQWLHFPNPAVGTGFATTHAQTIKTVGRLPSFAGATVRSGPMAGDAFPEHGEVQALRMPVLRLVAR
jgi:hypothetical protein